MELKDVIDWYTLGIQLEVPVRELKAIEAKYHGDINRCKQETLTVWLKKKHIINPFKEWKKMVGALRRMDEIGLADRLANAYSR